VSIGFVKDWIAGSTAMTNGYKYHECPTPTHASRARCRCAAPTAQSREPDETCFPTGLKDVYTQPRQCVAERAVPAGASLKAQGLAFSISPYPSGPQARQP